ncbi:MAG: tetratricopeptide repeat protein [Chloroflexi bacterium]|nr:tetratricopeptide repeat protein [Chloroflexota bacterium]
MELFRSVGARLGEANVLQAIGDVQQFRKDNDAALKSYAQALELFRSVGDRLGEANVLQAIGDVQQFRDERDAALKSYAQALELFRSVGARLGEANVLKAIGQLNLLDDPKRADDLLNQALSTYEVIGARYHIAAQTGNFGFTLLRLGELDRAQSYFVRATALFEQIGMADQAKQTHQYAIALQDADTRLKFAGALYQAKEYARAEREYRRVIELAPRNASGWLGLGNTLESLKRNDEAIDAYSQAIALAPDEAMLYRNRANILLNQDRLDEAAHDIARAAELEPDHIFTRARQGELALARGQFADALAHLQFAAEHDDDTGWQLELAIAQFANGDATQAQKTITAVIAQADADKRENARDWLARIVKLKPALADPAEELKKMLE